MTTPNFLIVGAAKSGTTSLFEYLRCHPEIYMPPGKELSFFGGRVGDASGSFEDYCRNFAAARNEKRIGEASSAYLYCAEAPGRIAARLGSDIRIIILLREPVTTAYSLWGHNVRNLYEELSFADALGAEEERIRDPEFRRTAGGWLYNYAYLDRVRYAAQVERYLTTFGREKVAVFIYEQFFDNPASSLRQVYRFLGVDETFELPRYARHNPAGQVRSRLLHRLSTEPMGVTRPFRRMLPAGLRRSLLMRLNRINTRAQPLPALDSALRARLRRELRGDIERLEQMLDLPLTRIWS